MKKYLLYCITLTSYSSTLAQEYLPLHLSYEPIVKETEVKAKDILFISLTKSFSTSDMYTDRIDSISFETINGLKKIYNLTNISQYSYWKSKKGNPLFEVSTRIVQSNFPVDNYKGNIPFWLSIHRGRFINSSVAIGILEKDKTNFKIWDKKKTIKRLTPIKKEKEALVFLYLMEDVFPHSVFDYLCKENDNYKIFTKTIKPTTIREEKKYFIINVFYYDGTYQSLYEIKYQLYKNGKYKILSKKLIYINTEDYFTMKY